MKDFYVYLPSNNEYLPTNKSNHYITKLDRELSLSGKLEVCLKEIHYPRSWATLRYDECSFVIYRSDSDTWREITIDAGYYESPQALVSALHFGINEPDVTLSYSNTSRKIMMEMPQNCSLHFSEPLSSMLGIGHGNIACNDRTVRGVSQIDMSRGIDSIYLYSDIVETKLVGDTSAPLVGVIPLNNEYGNMAYKEYASPVYTNLSKNNFSTIEIYLMDSGGRYIPFEFGKVTILLHFRKR